MLEHETSGYDIAPLVTIGLTCFNAQDTILRALDSALAQDWPNIEIIIVDDDSADDSARIVEAAIVNEPRARLIRHDVNMGPAGARNSILKTARGEFIAFFDDDDESLPNRISEQMKVLVLYEKRVGASLVACYASGERRYDNGYLIELRAIGSMGDECPNGPGLAEHLLVYRPRTDWFYGTGTPSCALFARKQTIYKVGGFDERLRRVEDADFAIRLALLGGHFIGTSANLFIQYATSAADKSPEKNMEAELFLAEKYKDFLRTIGGYYYARHWPKLRYWHFMRRYFMFALELAGLLTLYPLRASKHLLTTGPRRLAHERNIRRDR